MRCDIWIHQNRERSSYSTLSGSISNAKELQGIIKGFLDTCENSGETWREFTNRYLDVKVHTSVSNMLNTKE
jgi:hypothetical protein